MYTSDVHVTVHRVKFLIIKPTRCTNFSNIFLEWNSTCFGQFLCPSSKFFTVHTAVVYVIQVCWQLASRIRMELSSILILPANCQKNLEWNSTCFEQFLCPSSGVFHWRHSNGRCHTRLLTACEQDQDGTSILILLASCQQTCMTYTIAMCSVKNSWWCTEELSKTCRVSLQE